MFDDEDAGLENPDGRAFAAALRREVAAWARPPDHLMVDPPIASYPLVAWMDVLADGSALLTIGVHVAKGTAVGDELHNQLFLLPERPTSIRFQASGSPHVLAGLTSEWLLSLVSRDYARQEWVHRGVVYAHRYVVSSTGEPLSERYDHRDAPKRLRSRGQRWRHIRELGEPDRVVPVSVEY